MVIVYIWESHAKRHDVHVGHAALEIIGQQYISFWPRSAEDDQLKKVQKKQSLSLRTVTWAVPHIISHSYEEDCQEIGRSADHIIPLYHLNEVAMMRRWDRKIKRYNILMHNCSTVVADLLVAGYAHNYGRATRGSRSLALLTEVVGKDTLQQLGLVFSSETDLIGKVFYGASVSVWQPSRVRILAEAIEKKCDHAAHDHIFAEL